MLNKDTQAVLKQLTSINNSMVISDKMVGTDEFQSIFFQVNLDKIDSIPNEFGIFDVSNFLGALDLLDDAEVTLDNNVIKATDGSTTLEFITSLPSSLDNVDVNPEIITSTASAPSVLEFTLSTDIINKVKKASSVFKNFDTLWVVNTENGTELKLGTQNSFSKSSNSFQVKISPTIDTSKEFSLAIPIENVLKVPSLEYKLGVKYNEQRDAYRVVLENELFTFLLSLKM